MRGGSTRRRLARAAAAAVALLAAVTVAGPASATTTPVTGRIDGFSPNPDGTLTIGFSALGLPAGQTLDPNSVKVTIGGSDVDSQAIPASQATALPKRVTVLTIDTSGSMAAQGFAEPAKAAARAYLAGVPADVLVGLVSFNSTPRIVVEPTADHAAVSTALDTLEFKGGTALFDAVIQADRLLGTDGIRSQLLLSDGKDVDSANTEAKAVASLASSGVTLDAVALGPQVDSAQLNALAAAGGGGVVVPATDTQQLTAAFEAAALAQAGAVAVTAQVPEAMRGTSVNVTVTADAGGTQVTDDALYVLPGAGAVPSADPTEAYGPVPVAPADPGIFGKSWLLPVALGALGVGLFALLGVAFLSTDRDSQTSGRLRRRLSRYSLTPRAEEESGSGVARSAVEFAGRMVERRDIDGALALKLEAAGVPLRPAEWLLIHIGVAVALAVLFTLLSGFNIIATFIGLVIGLLLPYAYIAIKDERRKARFAAQLPDTLQLLSGSLAAGYSLPQAIDTVVRESDGPMAAELNRAIVEARLGVPIEDALDTVARRMNSVDFAWVVMAIRIQREVGGNLAEVLSSVAATMRERERLRRQVDVLSAEGRLSAVILTLLPILFIVYLVIARPEYLSVLYQTPIGLLMIVVGIILLIGGSFWLRKVVKVEV